MIITAFAGCGKTYWASNIPDSIDIPSMPYSWVLPDVSGCEDNKEKGAPYHIANPLYPENYLMDILKAESDFKYVIIPSSIRIIELLTEKYDRRICLVIPDFSLKEEYRKRYIRRDNTESFLQLFIGGWDKFLTPLMELDISRIILKSGEYLTDIKAEIDKMDEIALMQNKAPKKIRCRSLREEIDLLSRDILVQKQDTSLVVGSYAHQGHILHINGDFETKENRKDIYEIGRFLYENNLGRAWLVPADSTKVFDYCIKVSSREELIEKLWKNDKKSKETF